MLMRLIAALVVATPAAAAPMSAPREFKADYAISYYGVRIAKSSFRSRIEGEKFHLSGSFSSTGLAAVFAPTSGTTDVMGRIGAKGAEPSSYALRYTTGGKPGQTDIGYAKGNVVRFDNKPESKKPKPANFVPVTLEALKAAFDPLTASMIRASDSSGVCARTLRIFDGGMRVDFALSPAGEMPFSAGKTKGVAVKCKARFQPVAGYHKGSKDIEYLSRKALIEIAFAATGVADLWAPVAISLGSQVGTFKLYATQFGGS